MASGIAVCDDRFGIWTGTFVDAEHPAAVKECWRLAREVSDETASEMRRHNARIVRVNLVEVEKECAVSITS